MRDCGRSEFCWVCANFHLLCWPCLDVLQDHIANRRVHSHFRLLRYLRFKDFFPGSLFSNILRFSRCLHIGGSQPQAERSVWSCNRIFCLFAACVLALSTYCSVCIAEKSKHCCMYSLTCAFCCCYCWRWNPRKRKYDQILCVRVCSFLWPLFIYTATGHKSQREDLDSTLFILEVWRIFEFIKSVHIARWFTNYRPLGTKSGN